MEVEGGCEVYDHLKAKMSTHATKIKDIHNSSCS